MQNVVNCSRLTINPDVPEIVEFINRIDPLKPYFLDNISIKNGCVVASMDNEFLEISQNRTITEIKENDEEGFFNVVGLIKSIQNKYDWWYYSCGCGYPIQLSNSQFSCGKCGKNIENVVKNFKVILEVEDVTRSSEFTLYDHSAEMLFNLKLENVLTEFESKYSETPVILVGKVTSVLTGVNWWYDVKLFIAHSGGCNLFVFHDETFKYLMGKSCQSLLNEIPAFTSSEILELDPNIYMSELIGGKLVLMVDHHVTNDIITHVAYHVFKSSNDPSLIRLFELGEKGAMKKKQHSRGSANQLVSSDSETSSAVVLKKIWHQLVQYNKYVATKD
ncbi:hypothetical protein PIB30_033056 [Stylosanthes scabra]|uniref:Replication factor A C-terminal domain-containing protein n=1 Tax=Stylosanthes scabra TaxID=79078 RepID=A0ABU6YCS9_9FABA|nr:hypothetical protein [Stylosanthes scabra]